MVPQPGAADISRQKLPAWLIQAQRLSVVIAPYFVAQLIAAANACENAVNVTRKHAVIAGVLDDQRRLLDGGAALLKRRV